MTDARNNVRFTADVSATPDAVFGYFTNEFHEVWPGEMEHKRQADDAAEPLGLGFVRTMHTAAGKLDEEIVTHDRPGLIEYRVINSDDPKVRIHNHLGRIALTDDGDGGTHVDYTVTFDYRPSWQGPVAGSLMKLAWLRAKRRLARAFPG